MPEQLTKQEVNSKTDPSVAKQWDDDCPVDKKLEDFYSICDGLKTCMLVTHRPSLPGPVARSMAIAKRSGPDFLFLANAHSQKFDDLHLSASAADTAGEGNLVCVTFQDSKTQDWVSITGRVTTAKNDDPRIKAVWSRGAAAWFGDLGDGVHDASANDPRMTLLEVKPQYVSYWKAESTALGYVKEIVAANITGGVAVTGKLRQLQKHDIDMARKKHSELTTGSDTTMRT